MTTSPLAPEENNVILRFELGDRDAQDIFNANIDHIDVFAFDTAGLFVTSLVRRQRSTEQLPGMLFHPQSGRLFVPGMGQPERDQYAADPDSRHNPSGRLLHKREHHEQLRSALLWHWQHAFPGRHRHTVPENYRSTERLSRRNDSLKYAHKIINVLVQNYTDNGALYCRKTNSPAFGAGMISKCFS